MKTKIWVGVLFYSFMGCANKAPKSNLTSKSIPKEPEGYDVRYIPVQEEPVEENTVYEVVEEMPEFPGGIDKLLQFINDNMKYPTKAQTEGMQGKVIVQFIIDEDGYIIEPNIVRSVESSLDNEALRLIKMLPQWRPGTLKGKAVKVKYTVPVAFKLK